MNIYSIRGIEIFEIYNMKLAHGYITLTRLCTRFIGLITENTHGKNKLIILLFYTS